MSKEEAREGGNNIFIVSAGSYSDYSIIAVFSTEEAAERFAFPHGRTRDWNSVSSLRIEEFPLDRPVDDERAVYRVVLGRRGNVKKRYVVGEAPDPPYPRATEVFEEIWGESPRGFGAALKAACDKLAELKAEEAGIT